MMILLVLLLSLSQAFACSEDGSSGFAPHDGEPVPVGAKNANIATEDDFNRIISSVTDIYAPIMSAMGGELIVNRKWTDNTANANATRSGSKWTINMYGGLARHAAITPDGFALVVCHELGHHIGGAPKMGGLLGWLNRWASNEGQADYFSTLKCLRRVWMSEDNAAAMREVDVPEVLRNSCDASYRDVGDRALCTRIGMAGLSTATFLAGSAPAPRFEAPNATVVRSTNDRHPEAQCRLDTYLQGVMCDKAFSEDVSQSDEVQGTCHPSLGSTVGNRPLCWFKPRT